MLKKLALALVLTVGLAVPVAAQASGTHHVDPCSQGWNPRAAGSAAYYAYHTDTHGDTVVKTFFYALPYVQRQRWIFAAENAILSACRSPLAA